MMIHAMLAGFLSFLISVHAQLADQGADQRVAIRVMAMNAEDIGSHDLMDGSNPRLQRLAAIIQRVRPNILLLSEIAYDGDAANASLFVENYLAIAQETDLKPIEFNSLMPASNTGLPSSMDLNHDSKVITEFPSPRPSDSLGRPARQTNAGRDFGSDCYGFGTYPGQYALALLVDPTFTIDTNSIRTFQSFLWKNLPNHQPPTNADGTNWYTPEQWDAFRLSSKTFADIPVEIPGAQTVHMLISHPTPPAFDGPENRNKHRNRDEIRLIRAYIDNDPALIDDAGVRGGLDDGEAFVILGDLNADPVDGSSIGSPIVEFLFNSPDIGLDPSPSSPIHIDGLDPTDTSMFRLRVDYVLPSSGIDMLRTGIWRHGHEAIEGFPSDHFPVWAELAIPMRITPDSE